MVAGLAQHAYLFKAHEIDFEVLLQLQVTVAPLPYPPSPTYLPPPQPQVPGALHMCVADRGGGYRSTT